MNLTEPHLNCPLCHGKTTEPFYNGKFRHYLRCRTCRLIFVPDQYFLTADKEKAEYDLHINDPADQGYRNFLSRLFIPMQKLLSPASQGLDFGSGPGPTLSIMFEEVGHHMHIYDKFYENFPERLKKKYDFITATEVVEHLHAPGDTLGKIWQCLVAGGTLGIMTKLARDQKAFRSWHYKNDLTHVAFFSRETFIWLAESWQAQLTFIGNDVIILKKHLP